MNLMDYVRIIARRGWIIVLAAALTAGAAFLFSATQPRVYRATQQILVKPGRPDNGLTITMRSLMSSYVVRLNIEDRAAEVINALQLDMLPTGLEARATADLNTFTISIDVDMTDPATAERVAQLYGRNFIEWRNQENAPQRNEDRITAELLGKPSLALFRPNTTVNVAAGGLLGAILGGVIVFILEWLDANILRRREDVERLGLTVVGLLPEVE
jgi:uncharacterized protein involved in exopolysaccharide biosynthesis